jgi:hypothetical protein
MSSAELLNYLVLPSHPSSKVGNPAHRPVTMAAEPNRPSATADGFAMRSAPSLTYGCVTRLRAITQQALQVSELPVLIASRHQGHEALKKQRSLTALKAAGQVVVRKM